MAYTDTSSTTADTTYRLDMWPYGSPGASPIGIAQKDWVQNFYMAHCDTTGATAVRGFSRVIYPDIYNRIDMHFYSGSMGQKIAFVLEPGCDPDDLKLAFEGQDSIALDLFGNLKLYLNGSWMVIPVVQAYQVDGNGDVVQVNWVADYQVINGVGVVGFTWSSYNAAWPLIFQIGIPPFGPSNFDEEGLCWSTYMGGSERDDVYESVEDEFGNYYIVGTTGSTFMSFP